MSDIKVAEVNSTGEVVNSITTQPILEIQNKELLDLFGNIALIFIYSICPIVLLALLFKSDSYPEITDDIKILTKINMFFCIVLNVYLCILIYFNHIGKYANIFNKIYKFFYFCNFIFTCIVLYKITEIKNFKDNNLFILLYRYVYLSCIQN
jgi:hypothetical protein